MRSCADAAWDTPQTDDHQCLLRGTLLRRCVLANVREEAAIASTVHSSSSNQLSFRDWNRSVCTLAGEEERPLLVTSNLFRRIRSRARVQKDALPEFMVPYLYGTVP